MHHLIRASTMRSVDVLVHIAQFNIGILIDFITQSNEATVLIETMRNKTGIIINSRHGDKQFILNDKTEIRIYCRNWNRQFY